MQIIFFKLSKRICVGLFFIPGRIDKHLRQSSDNKSHKKKSRKSLTCRIRNIAKKCVSFRCFRNHASFENKKARSVFVSTILKKNTTLPYHLCFLHKLSTSFCLHRFSSLGETHWCNSKDRIAWDQWWGAIEIWVMNNQRWLFTPWN